MNLEDLVDSILQNAPLIKPLSLPSERQMYDTLTNLGIVDHSLLSVLDELYLNAKEHGSEKIQIYITKVFNHFYFVITDLGSGIHSTLPKNKKLSDTLGKSASALIRLACEEGITGTGVVGRGIGLHLLSDFVKNRRAESLILSDKGLMIQIGSLYMEKESRQSIAGTLVALKLAL